MDVFLRALLIIIFLAIFIGLIVWICTTESIAEWFIDIFIGAIGGVAVCYLLSPIIDAIIDVAGDDNTYKAGWWVIILIGIAVTAFIAIWLHENTNLGFK